MQGFEIESTRVQIYRWAYRLLQNHDDALDATQNVLLRILSSGSVSPTRRVAWLRRVTINHCIDHIRRRRVQSSTAEAVVEDSSPAEHQEQAQRIAVALEQLTEIQRLVLLAKTYDDETFAQIAASVELSLSSVKTHYLRALRKMRDVLRPAWEKEQ